MLLSSKRSLNTIKVAIGSIHRVARSLYITPGEMV